MKKTLKVFVLVLILALSLAVVACDDPENCEHEYEVSQTIESSCEILGKEISRCKKCGEQTERDLPLVPSKHPVLSDWSYDEEYHYHATSCNHSVRIDEATHERGADNKCTVCDYDMGCLHEWSSKVTKEPTCTEKGVLTYTCIYCEDVKTEDIAVNPENHVFSSDWASDKEYHWHQAVCGHEVVSDHGEHVEGEDEKCEICSRSMACVHEWIYDIETPSTCITLGVNKKTCYLCKTIEYAYSNYNLENHVYSDEWDCDEENHWYSTTCGHNEKKDLSAHVFEDGVCGECNYVCKHAFDNGVYDAENKKTTYTCTLCSITKFENGLPNVASQVIVTNKEPSDNDTEKKYYTNKLKIDKNDDGKLILRKEYKTFYEKGGYDTIVPDFPMAFTYTGNLLTKELYDADYYFNMEKTPKKVFGTAEFNTREFNKMIFNFIRFIYICTDGAVELSFEYDTSFVYQVKGMKFGFRGRFVVESVREGFTAADTIKELLQSEYSGNSTYLDTYNNLMGMKVGFLDFDDSTTGLQVGDYYGVTWK